MFVFEYCSFYLCAVMKRETSPVRERILETATLLFYTQGYNLTGINQIIEEADIAKASLYQHFPSKEDLAVAYLAQKSKDYMNAVENAVASGNSPKEKVLLAFDFLKKHQENSNFRGCNFLNIISEVPLGNVKIIAEVQKQKASMQRFFKRILEGTDNEHLSDEVFLIFEGATVTSTFTQNTDFIDLAIKVIEEKL